MSMEPKENPQAASIHLIAELLVRKTVRTILDSIMQTGGGDLIQGAQKVSLDIKEADKLNAKVLDLLEGVLELGEDIQLIADFVEDANDAVEQWRANVQTGICKGTFDELAFLYGEARAENEEERMEEPPEDLPPPESDEVEEN